MEPTKWQIIMLTKMHNPTVIMKFTRLDAQPQLSKETGST
jgi:hypothetical protein